MSVARLVFAIFLVLQVADGLITYAAVLIFGPLAEGNPLLQVGIYLIGPGPALLAAKVLACACGTLLYTLGVTRALVMLTALYLFAAIGPWLHLLAS